MTRAKGNSSPNVGIAGPVSINIRQAKQVLQALAKNACVPPRERFVPFFWGPPGTGKTDIVRQVAQESKIGFTWTNLTQHESVELSGLLYPDKEHLKASFLPLSYVPTEGQGIWMLDDFGNALPETQTAAYSILCGHRAGQTDVGPGWILCAASNKVEHRSYVFQMPTAAKNRVVHYEVVPDYEVWLYDYAIPHNVHATITAFLRKHVDLFHNFDPEKEENAFPTARSWTMAHHALSILGDHEADTEIGMATLAGAVGQAAATQFRSYVKYFERLPNIEAIFEGKGKPPPEDLDVLWCTISSILNSFAGLVFEKKNQKALENVVKWGCQVPNDMMYLFARGIMAIARTNPDWEKSLMNNPVFVKIATENIPTWGSVAQ